MHSSDLKWYAVILLLILILGSLIFMAIKGQKTRTIATTQNSSTDFSLFDSVNSSVNGKITQVENNKIYFENQRGEEGEADALENLSISDMNSNDLPSSDLKKIQLNKTAGINFILKDKKFYITSITYPQP